MTNLHEVQQATRALLNGNMSIQVSGADISYGQAAMVASLPVVLASDQTDIRITLDGESVAVTGTFYQATQPGREVHQVLPLLMRYQRFLPARG